MRRQTKLMEKMMAHLGKPAVAAAVDGSLAWHQARTKRLLCSMRASAARAYKAPRRSEVS
jgi:hypothetical protein